MGTKEGFEKYINELENSGPKIPSPPILVDLDELFGSDNAATLTVKVDVDCKLYVDGDLVDDAIQANQIKKIPVPLGEHIITIESYQHNEIAEDREIEVKEAGKNQVLLVKGLQEKERELIQRHADERNERERAEREREEEIQRKERIAKEEQENMRKGIEYYNSGDDDLAIQCFEKVLETSDNSDAMLFIGKCYRLYPGDKTDRRNAVTWFVKAADKGNAEAYYYLGDCYERGYGLKQNHEEAAKWFEKAVEKGNVDAMKALARQAIDHKNAAEAINWYEKAADLGDTESMRMLGEIFSNLHKWLWITFEDILKKNEYYDIDKAMEWYKKAADLGDADAMLTIGTKYYLGEGVGKDFSKASEWFEKIGELDDEYELPRPLGYTYKDYYLNKIGNLFEREHDYVKAMEWYKKAADFGNVSAMKDIGRIYLNGEGVRKNIEEGIRWCEKAWETDHDHYDSIAIIYADSGLNDKALEVIERAIGLGNGNAMFNLGCMYYLGFGCGVHKDYCKAFDLLEKAASNDGDYKYDAMNSLGVLYNLGLGVRKDYGKAMEYYKKAGTKESRLNIGRMYFLGEGVPQDYYEAKRWYQKGEWCIDWSDREFRCLDVGLPEMNSVVICSYAESNGK